MKNHSSSLIVITLVLLSLSLCLALLIFMGTWLFLPDELTNGAEDHTAFFLVLGAEIGLLVAFLLWQFVGKGKYPTQPAIIALLTLSFMAGLLILWSYIRYTTELWEAWITQAGWYIRENGVMIGGFLGVIAATALFLIYWLIALSQILERDQQISLYSVLVGLVAVHLMLFNGFFSSAGLLNMLIFGLIEFGTLLLIFVVHFFIKGECAFENSSSDTPVISITENTPPNLEPNEMQGTSKRYMKRNLTWFSVFIIIQTIMWGVSPLYYPIKPDSLLIFSIPLVAGLLIVNYWSLASKMKRTVISPFIMKNETPENPPKNAPTLTDGLLEQIGIVFLGIFEIVRIVGCVYIIFYVCYGFPTPFKMPDFHRLYWEFAIFGALALIIVRKSPLLQKIFYIVSLSLLAWLIVLINDDIVLNMYTYYDNFETIYPFQVLLSPLHACIAGIACGYILSYEITRAAVRYVDRSNLGIRGMFLTMFFFIIGLGMGALSQQGVLGGRIQGTGYYAYDWDRTEPFIAAEFLENSFLVVFLVILSAIGLFLLMDVVIPKLFDVIVKKSRSSLSDEKQKKIYFVFSPRTRKASVLVAIVLLSLIPATVLFFRSPEIKNGYALPMVSSENGVNVYAAPSYIRIGPNQPLQPQAGGPIDYYELKMARNEYESVQLIVAPERRALNGFRYIVSNFVDESTGLSIDPWYITVRYVENVIDEQYPDRLVPFSMLHLIEPRNHGIWITAYVPYGSSAGLYDGNINFTFGDNESFLFPLRLNVWNYTIPYERHTRTNLGPQTSDQNHIDTFQSHRINSYGIPVHRAWSEDQLNSAEEYTCFLNETTDQWAFNWTWWDAQTNASINKGVNGFYINCPLGMPREPWWFEKDGVTLSKWGIQTGNFYAGVQAHLEDLRDHFATDWFKYCYIYFIDEFQMFIPEGYEREEYFILLEGFLSLINSSAPDIRIMTTTPPSRELLNIRQYIDIYCPITSDYNEEEWNAAMDEGKEMWMYPCVGPQAPWPNSHLYNRLFEIRVLYWQVFYYKIQGFLYWSSSAYYHGRYGMGFNAWGDGWFVYMDDEGRVFDSIRWENYRDAIEDYESIWLLNASLSAMPNSDQKLSELNNLVSAVTRDRYHYCDSGDIILQNRYLIGDQLSALQTSGEFDVIALGEAEWVF